MGKKDRRSMEELWSKRFDEETEMNQEEPLSRKAKREREKGISPILTVTLIFMALLIILPTSAYLWWSSRDGLSEEPASPSVEQVAENSQDEETADAQDAGERNNEGTESDGNFSADSASEETADADNESGETSGETASGTEDASAAETVTDESGIEADAEENIQEQEQANGNEASNTENSAETASESAVDPASEPVQDADYYTVEAGDNMYRIALNHGMSTQELMQLNGVQDETVYVGQKLRVN
ncbi:LysM domain-containing protein [Alkalibacterium subtropicum]|uniref:LysM domain-containing protein n=1 Tax=Alkalibacterium subtropicum TaxID=753702 RepID=A0A1I1ES24_9LACT|nr:LysM peptidoglycan-binding domain-containing protein [Alkalibacterium subtropicum]SFB88308.1 LysM domain-containing protein [Alkalibacterium subtropicum]